MKSTFPVILPLFILIPSSLNVHMKAHSVVPFVSRRGSIERGKMIVDLTLIRQ
jgi:hypothetical protein